MESVLEPMPTILWPTSSTTSLVNNEKTGDVYPGRLPVGGGTSVR